MKNASIGAAIGLSLMCLVDAVAAVVLPGAAPAATVVSSGLLALGVGGWIGSRLGPGGRRGTWLCLAAGLVTLMGAAWGPLIRVAHALLAGASLHSPGLAVLWLASLLLVVLPLGLAGAACAIIGGSSSKDLRAGIVALGGAALATLVGGWILLPSQSWQMVLCLAGLLLLLGSLLDWRGSKRQPDKETSGQDPVLAFVLTGAGFGIVLCGAWRMWQFSSPIQEAGALGAAALLAGCAVGLLILVTVDTAWAGLIAALVAASSLFWSELRLAFEAIAPSQGGQLSLAILALALIGPGVLGTALGGVVAGLRQDGAKSRSLHRIAGILSIGIGVGWLSAAAGASLLGTPLLLSLGIAVLAIGLLLRSKGNRIVVLLCLAPAVLAAALPLTPVYAKMQFAAVESESADAMVAAIRHEDEGEILVNGSPLVAVGYGTLPNRVMAGHLPALLLPYLEHTVVFTAGTLDAVTALRSHGAEVDHRVVSPALVGLGATLETLPPISSGASILEAREARAWPGLKDPGLLEAPPSVPPEALPAAGFLLPAGLDAIVVAVPAVNHPYGAPWFSEEFYREAAFALGEEGVLVQLASLAEASPLGAAERMRALAEVFPNVDVWAFDGARSGEVLLLASSSPMKMPYRNLLSEERGNLEGAAQLDWDLARSGLTGWDDLIHGAIRRVRVDGGEVRLPERKELRTDVTSVKAFRAMLFGRQREVWEVKDFVATRLGYPFLLPAELLVRASGWKEDSGSLQIVTQAAKLASTQHLGIYRELRSELTIEGYGQTLTVQAVPMQNPDANRLIDPLVSAGEENVVRSGKTSVHSHSAAWHLKQMPGTPRDQTLLVVWYCPVQARRYFLQYRTVEGSPNVADPLVGWVARNVSCDHP